MRHETLEKLIRLVNSKKGEAIQYEFWLGDDIANQLMVEARNAELKGGKVILFFDGTKVMMQMHSAFLTNGKIYYVKILRIDGIYEWKNSSTGKTEYAYL